MAALPVCRACDRWLVMGPRASRFASTFALAASTSSTSIAVAPRLLPEPTLRPDRGASTSSGSWYTAKVAICRTAAW